MKGQMAGSCGLDGDIHIAHSVRATSLQSDVSTRKERGAFLNWFPNWEQFLKEDALSSGLAVEQPAYLKLRAFCPTFQIY